MRLTSQRSRRTRWEDTSSSASASKSTAASVTSSHPFTHVKGLLVIIPQDRVDVEGESAFYDEFDQQAFGAAAPRCRSPTTIDSRSLISRDIWLGDGSRGSTGFTRDVKIGGWTSVGHKLGEAYVVYDCAVLTISSNFPYPCVARYP